MSRDQIVVLRRDGEEGNQLYSDGWKLTFGGEHAVRHIDVETQYCSHETYIMLKTSVTW